MQLRQAILQIHRGAGLTVGLAIVFVAITGLAMLFRPQLEPLVDADLRKVAHCAARLPLDTLVAKARALHPEGAIRQLEISGAGFGATVVRFEDKQGVFVAYTGIRSFLRRQPRLQP